MRRNHLIHRKRSPFPYEGKDLNACQWELAFAVERVCCDASRQWRGLQVTSSTAERSPFPSRGRTITRSKGCGCSNIERRDSASLAVEVTLRVRSVNTFP